MLKLVAPEVGGVKDSAGTWHDADEKLEGGPSVLFDAVAVLPSKEGAAIAGHAPGRPRLRRRRRGAPEVHRLRRRRRAAVREGRASPGWTRGRPDERAGDAAAFVAACRKLRFWDRADAER